MTAAPRSGTGDAAAHTADVCVDDPCIIENRLACYVPALRNYDDMFRLPGRVARFWNGVARRQQRREGRARRGGARALR